MRRLLATLALAAAVAAPAPRLLAQAATPAAEPDQRAAVMAVVRGLFDAMRRGDSAAVRASFHPDVQMKTMLVRNGVPEVRGDTLGAFVRAVGTPHAEVWDERLRDDQVQVQVDANLATVWAPYAFFAGVRFSHCGVNTFTLGRDATGWRIVSLADTRRRTGCPESPATPPAR